MHSVILYSLVSLLVLFQIGSARTLRVPIPYTTIQSAIDETEDGDTILVQPGLYAEALVTNERSLAIIGESAPDTVTGIGVVIDPTTLDSSNSLACLTAFDGDSIRLRNLWFRNGEAMHVGRVLYDPGGIDNSHGLRRLSLSSCRFDSVYVCVARGIVIELDSIIMHNAQNRCVAPGDSGRIIAHDCRFHGAMTGIAVWGRSGSTFVRCSFSNSGTGYLLSASKDSITVTNCKFGPFNNPCGLAVTVTAGTGTQIENNVFHDIETGYIGVRINQYTCSTTTVPGFQHPIVRNNIFEHFSSGESCQYGVALYLECDGEESGYLGEVTNNIFSDIHSRGFYGVAINVREGGALLVGNRFENLLPTNTGSVYSLNVVSPETLFMRSNAFDSVEYAIQHGVGNEATDARWNWWGDITGPYSSSENPNGLGAEVDWGVQFVPWLTADPDSSADTTEVAVEEQPVLLPSEYSLSAYPNPFNAITTLEIEVARAGEYEVVLVDLLGRRVATLFEGRIDHTRSLNMNAESFASGVYFAQLRDAGDALAVAKLLILK